MEKSETSNTCISNKTEEKPSEEVEELLQTLPRERNFNGDYLYFYKGFWCSALALKGMVPFQRYFQASRDTDIILATSPKSGTTWLKALTYSIVNRTKFSLAHNPVLTTNPHGLVPFFEFDLYFKHENPNLDDLPTPRIFSTHTPFKALPQSIIDSKCRIVYMTRNPLDQFISYWHFLLKIQHENMETASIDEALDLYCRGLHWFGPFWEHMLGYWKASKEIQQKVLFLKYEDLKEDVTSHMKRLAEFLGVPFSVEEEKEGVIEQISSLCSFDNLKNLEVNKSGRALPVVSNSSLFRTGKVGDWVNFLSPPAAERLAKLANEKFGCSGLTFQ